MNQARMIIDRDYAVSRTDPKLFSSFVEPLGRCIYGGLYEPGHPCADENGFRQDVLSLIKPLNLSLNRFPGGNYTSTFRWETSAPVPVEAAGHFRLPSVFAVRPRDSASPVH